MKYIHHMPKVRPVPARATSAASTDQPCGLHHRGHRGDRADDALAERDDGQQAVALGDVVGVPRRATGPPLGQRRPGQLDQHQHDGEGRRRRKRHVRDDLHDPAELGDRDRHGVGEAGAPTLRALPGRAQPLGDHRHPHHDVAEHHHAVVQRGALVDGGEHRRQPEREDDHPDHLDHGREPVDPVVGVEGRGEPGEVDPRPGDREHGEAEPGQRRPEVPLGQQMGRLVPGDAECDHEGQVEQQLQRGGDPARLVRVAPGHPDDPVGQPVHGRRHGVAHALHDVSADGPTGVLQVSAAAEQGVDLQVELLP